MSLQHSELILNEDGSIYHLNLLPGEVAKDIITVGDPERVDQITQYFDKIELTKTRREFKTVTGYIKGKRLTVISTGIGTDNIDIVMNELDALFNVDLKTREVKHKITQLRFYRIGTCGGLRKDIPVDNFVVSNAAIGLDGLMVFYKSEKSTSELALQHLFPSALSDRFYWSETTIPDSLDDKIFIKGITITAAGFYAPQGRSIRLASTIDQLYLKLGTQSIDHFPIINLEMETAGIYGLGKLLGHHCLSFSVILANRATGAFSAQPTQSVQNLIQAVLSFILQRKI